MPVCIIQYAQKIVVATTMGLVGVALVLFALWLAVLSQKAGLFVRIAGWLGGLTPLGKIAVMVVVGLFTLWGGSKEGCFPTGKVSAGRLLNRDMEVARTLDTSGDVLAITDFEMDWRRQSIGFDVAWTENLFDATDSRILYLFGSTNLFERRWMPLGTFRASTGTNACSFAMTSEDVEEALQGYFPDLFDGLGFFRLGLGFDADDDGLADSVERFWTLTDPLRFDTDGDGMPDGWEVLNGLDPLADDAGEDVDGDGIDNFNEYRLGTNPISSDTDGDGLGDGEEVLWTSFASPLPWVDFSVLTNLTDVLVDFSCISIGLPLPVMVQQMVVTNMTVDVNGVVYFNRAGYVNPAYSCGACAFGVDVVNINCLTVAPYWSWLSLSEEAAPSSVKFGLTTVGTNGYYVLECRNLYGSLNSYETNSISFQMAFPTGHVDRIHVRYADCVGEDMDGRNASIGFQGFGTSGNVSYCYYEREKIFDGMGMTFLVGFGSDPTVADTDGDGLVDGVEVKVHGSDPRLADTDGDGLSDAREVSLGTSLRNPDTDGDGLLDGWEISHGLNPLSPTGDDGADEDIDSDGLTNLQEQIWGSDPRNADTDGDGLVDGEEVANGTDIGSSDTDRDGLTDGQEVRAGFNPLDPDMDRDGMPDGWEVRQGLDPRNAVGNDGAEGDPDHDGLSNIHEYLNNTDPHVADTDGDGVPDGIEVERGSDPTDPTDGGIAPDPGLFRTLEFNIYGDWAAWEMEIEGLGPEDTRIRRISMGRPDAPETSEMKMRKGNAYRLTMRWLNCGDHDDEDAPWYCWQAQIDGRPSGRTYENYSSTRRDDMAKIVVGNGWVAENAGGLLTSHVHVNAREGGNVAGRLDATLYILEEPKVIPDYDRDGKIDGHDMAVYDEHQTPFWFWVNDDGDSGDVNDSVHDRPGSGWNGQNDTVDGRGDLLDFTPVLLDVSDVFPPGTPDAIRKRMSWKLESNVANAVWTSLSASDAGSFHRIDGDAAFGPDLTQYADKANVTTLLGGVALPEGFVKVMEKAGGRGVIMVEGRSSGLALRLSGAFDEFAPSVVEGELDIRMKSVEDMYRFVSLRGAENTPGFIAGIPELPSDLMVGAKDVDVFFTHGFNVSEEGAHAWGAEVFKRLWQSGSNARFWALTWTGDYNWLGSSFNALHYQQDVQNALMTGEAFRALVERAQPDPSKRILMTQSLGNMVACEALRQGLAADKYFMFNAAVATECFDGTLQNANPGIREKYVPSEWRRYVPLSWAANWYRWFAGNAEDSRSRLGWVNRYAAALENANEVYNYYSTGDEVFHETANPPWLLEGMADSTANYAWQKQETQKGGRWLAGTAYGGWGFHTWRIAGFDYQYTDAEAADMVADGSITNNPVFNRGYQPMLEPDATQDEVMCTLAKYVPAVSNPIGGRALFSADERSADLNESRFRSGWVDDVSRGNSWRHSDMKDVAYFYVWPLYDELVSEKGCLK